jgi:hypothetical protein
MQRRGPFGDDAFCGRCAPLLLLSPFTTNKTTIRNLSSLRQWRLGRVVHGTTDMAVPGVGGESKWRTSGVAEKAAVSRGKARAGGVCVWLFYARPDATRASQFVEGCNERQTNGLSCRTMCQPGMTADAPVACDDDAGGDER